MKVTNLIEWSAAVRERDGNVCAHCGSTEWLHAHHIKPRATYPELALNVDNGVTLCRECHAKEHAHEGEQLIRLIMNCGPRGNANTARRHRPPEYEPDDHPITSSEFRQWRARRELTQKAAAEALGLSPRQIWSYEHGSAEVPKTVRLAMAAIALGLTDYPT